MIQMPAQILSRTNDYILKLASSEDDLRAAQQLRYDVFVRELGGSGDGVDHAQHIETDDFDAASDHLIVFDATDNAAVGVYRVLRGSAAQLSGFYCDQEYDLTRLRDTKRSLLELGRSCVRADHRNGPAMFLLWSGLAKYIALHRCEVLFGVASLHGTDMAQLAAPLSLLHHRHLAPSDLRPKALIHQSMNLICPSDLDRRAAMVAMPPLIKAYLRLGGGVGDGAFVDHDFQCTDVCMVMDTAAMNEKQARLYAGAST